MGDDDSTNSTISNLCEKIKKRVEKYAVLVRHNKMAFDVYIKSYEFLNIIEANGFDVTELKKVALENAFQICHDILDIDKRVMDHIFMLVTLLESGLPSINVNEENVEMGNGAELVPDGDNNHDD